jgi:hypothetical protein
MARSRHYLLLFAGLAASLAMVGGSPAARASSHAEAPMISEDPEADNTDLYAFRSPEDPTKVVVIANYNPLEEPGSGPNFKKFSDSVLYEIKVDRNNDGVPDLSFQFQFTNKIQSPGTFLNFLGPITSLTSNGSALDSGANVNQLLNRYQTYSVRMVTPGGGSSTPGGGGAGATNGGPFGYIQFSDQQKAAQQTPPAQGQLLAQNILVAPPNVGPSTFPNYAALADAAIYTIPGTGIRVFAGQRDDPFFIDLGAFFDLLQVRPYRSLSALKPPGPDRAVAADSLAGYNVHSIAIEIPITVLTGTATAPGASDPKRLVGFWATASRQRMTVLRDDAGPSDTSGGWVQISRLGNPLVNELFIPIKDPNGYTKDYWNRVTPAQDSVFIPRFQNPEPSLLLAKLYPALQAVVPNINADQSGFTGPRSDLLGGVTPLLNFAPDELRLDTSLPAVAPGAAGYNRLGVIAGDLGGFPNGRRLSDDVVDIYMRAAAGVLVPGNVTGTTTSRAAFLDSIKFGDGVDANTDMPFLTRFPFVGLPHDGLNPPHNNNKAQGTD